MKYVTIIIKPQFETTWIHISHSQQIYDKDYM